MANWNEIKGKDEDSVIKEDKPEGKKEEVKFENEIPAHCTGCFWIQPNKDNSKIAECRYDGEYYDDFIVDTTTLKDGTVVGDCHSKAEDATEDYVKKCIEMH